MKKIFILTLSVILLFSSVCFAFEDDDAFEPLTISNPHWEYYYLKDYRYRDYDRTVCSVCTLALSKENKNAHYFNFYITKDKKYAVLHCAEYNTTLKDFVDCENTDPFHYEPIPPDTAIEELYYIVFPQ